MTVDQLLDAAEGSATREPLDSPEWLFRTEVWSDFTSSWVEMSEHSTLLGAVWMLAARHRREPGRRHRVVRFAAVDTYTFSADALDRLIAAHRSPAAEVSDVL